MSNDNDDDFDTRRKSDLEVVVREVVCRRRLAAAVAILMQKSGPRGKNYGHILSSRGLTTFTVSRNVTSAALPLGPCLIRLSSQPREGQARDQEQVSGMIQK